LGIIVGKFLRNQKTYKFTHKDIIEECYRIKFLRSEGIKTEQREKLNHSETAKDAPVEAEGMAFHGYSP
jgi:hypothetical protein